MKSNSREQIFVEFFLDCGVQASLALRVIWYWFACLAAITGILLVGRVLSEPSLSIASHLRHLTVTHGSVALVSLCVLPLVLVDVVKLSNRFVGPLFRLRAAMRQSALREPVPPVTFRRRDYWQDLAEEFNAVIARISALEEHTATPAASAATGHIAGPSTEDAATDGDVACRRAAICR